MCDAQRPHARGTLCLPKTQSASIPNPPTAPKPGGGWFADVLVDAHSRPLLDDRRVASDACWPIVAVDRSYGV